MNPGPIAGGGSGSGDDGAAGHDGVDGERGATGGGAVFSASGVQTVRAGASRLYVTEIREIEGVVANVGTAPEGAAFIVDVKRNGLSIYSTTANRPTIAIGTLVSAIPPVEPDQTALVAGDWLTVDVVQVGSTTPGSDLTVQVQMAVVGRDLSATPLLNVPNTWGAAQTFPDASIDESKVVGLDEDLSSIRAALPPSLNLLSAEDSGFEGGTTGGWTAGTVDWDYSATPHVSAGAVVSNVPGNAIVGTHSLECSTDGSRFQSFISPFVPVTPGQTYTLRAYITPSEAGRDVHTVLLFDDGTAPMAWGDSLLYPSASVTPVGPYEVMMTGVAPETGQTGQPPTRVRGIITTDWKADGTPWTFWLDCVSIAPTAPIPDDSIATSKVHNLDEDLAAFQDDLSSIRNLLPPSLNLLSPEGSGFEGGTTGGWVGYAVSNATVNAIVGFHSLECSTDGAQSQTFVSPSEPITPGQTYTFRAYITPSEAGRDVLAGIQFNDDTGSSVNPFALTADSVTPVDPYEVMMTAVAPEGSTSVVGIITTDWKADGTPWTFWLDCVSIAPTAPIPDDSIATSKIIGLDEDLSGIRAVLSPVFMPEQADSAPPYVKGGVYFDTTLSKLCVGGATAWETVTSS